MRSRYQVREPHAAHFVPSSIVAWLPVFTRARCCDLLPESFACCREHKGLLIHAWVILDNHRGGGWEHAGGLGTVECRTWNVEGSGLSITGNSRQTRLIMACDTALADRVMAHAAGHEPFGERQKDEG